MLGIVGLFVTICAPIAWYMGSKAQKEIAASGQHYSNEQNIKIGKIMGMVLSILAIVGIVIAHHLPGDRDHRRRREQRWLSRTTSNVTTAFEGDLIALRRRLHQMPEIGLDLPQTQAIVLDELAGLGLEITTGTSVSSVVGVLRGTGDHHAGRVVLLRGDMDALPVVEASGEAVRRHR